MPIVILYVTEGCNLHCCMCSYRNPTPGELSLEEIDSLADRLAAFGLRHIVYSGGEPLTRRDFPAICATFGRHSVKQTLLTNGLLLEKRLPEIGRYLDEIIVSLDGPDAATHDRIRGHSFEQVVRGIRAARDAAPAGQTISIRTVLQKQNFRELSRMVDGSRSLGVDRVSFLAADVSPDAFGRSASGSDGWTESVLLEASETEEFRRLVTSLIATHRPDFEQGFISESPLKMYHIVEYFEASAGKRPFPQNRCNAPNVSAVITSTGEIRPCFFLPGFGSVRGVPLQELNNNAQIRATRRDVKANRLERCATCVCTLNVRPLPALLDRF